MWIVDQFRGFKRPASSECEWEELEVSTWVREPDFPDNYRELYELEQKLSSARECQPRQLLSTWRLANDDGYAEWAYGIGLREGKVTFFGLEEATNWGYGRKSAFMDALLATERMLDAHIIPCWRLVFTKRLTPDMEGILSLVEDLKLQERCKELGGAFKLVVDPIVPDGQAWNIETLRPTFADIAALPAWLVYQSEELVGGTIGMPEAVLAKYFERTQAPAFRGIADVTRRFRFIVTPSFDVYPNFTELSGFWCLGNMLENSMEEILDVLENNATEGLRAAFDTPLALLAERYGNHSSTMLYTPNAIKYKWFRMYAESVANQSCN